MLIIILIKTAWHALITLNLQEMQFKMWSKDLKNALDNMEMKS